ncbi:arylsulfatase [Rubritalea tangerina]|uniref:Arylsulfatase n=2 Tax=Rubritalea tangerina TaxID=430798 RepID=A0ABW4ZFD6_9BACT
MMKHLLTPIATFLMAGAMSLTQAAEKPNIIFILADDLGHGELGCYGQEKIKTPHIDQLAKEGMLFHQHYTGAPVCAPARCVLMTGKHLAHAEIRGNRDSGNGRKFPGQWPITDGAVTIAEVLKEAGYATGAFGKWGLGPSDSSGSPNKQGFDRFYGYNCQRNAHSFYPPFLDSDEEEVTINKKPIPGHLRKMEGPIDANDYRAEMYSSDLVLEESIKFIDKNKDKPFFLYLPFLEPHVAMQPPQEWIDKYPAEWDDPEQGGKGVYRGQNGYLPHDRPRAAYAAMVSDLDEHVGTVLARIKKHGLEDNTVVIFTSDNGTTHQGGDPKFHIGGCDAEFFNATAGLRGYKGSCYEGGIRIPAIVKWPGKIKAGSTNNEPTYFPDWFPTLVTMAGAEMPKEKLDGLDMNGVLAGKPLPKREELMIWDFHNYGGIIAIRDGKWKALRRGLLARKGKSPQPWELYDIESDPKETKNLAQQYPEKVKRLEAFWLETRTVEDDFKIPFVDGKKSLD